ncbi:MAG: DUF6608 family protein [Bacillota bacterium]
MKLKLSVKDTLILVCVLYTVLTLVSSTIGLIAGRTTDTHTHLLMRFAITFVGISSLQVFRLVSTWSPLGQIALHYVVTTSMVLALVGLSGFWMELHPNAYRDVFLNFTVVYALVTGVILLWGRRKRQ